MYLSGLLLMSSAQPNTYTYREAPNMWSPPDFESFWMTDTPYICRKKQRNCRPGSRPGTIRVCISPRYQEAPARSELAVQIITHLIHLCIINISTFLTNR